MTHKKKKKIKWIALMRQYLDPNDQDIMMEEMEFKKLMEKLKL